MAEIAIIGAGPAGLFAAEHLGGLGHQVRVYERMAAPSRKFLLAGRGGLNLTHSETLPRFLARYHGAQDWLRPSITAFPPEALRAWCEGLGQPCFVGSSGRVFPASFKAAPLLRAWLRRLDGLGVRLALRHDFQGWDADGALCLQGTQGSLRLTPAATLLALGGASWPRMGADGGWVAPLRALGVMINPLRPANCGVVIGWSAHMQAHQAGQPLKRVALQAEGVVVRGEAMITAAGLEGGAVYALVQHLRARLDQNGEAALLLDLRPDLTAAELAQRVDGARQGRSLSKFLAERASLSPAAVALVQEALHGSSQAIALAPGQAALMPLSRLIKAMPLRVQGLAGMARAISCAGGIAQAALTEDFMLRALPGVFAAGEMLDWEAPTGGYLLQACFATGLAAARGIAGFLAAGPHAAAPAGSD